MMPVKMPSYAEFTAFFQANADAMLGVNATMCKGMEDITRLTVDMYQQALEQTVAASKAMLEVRSLPQMLDVQSDYARNVYDLALADSAKLSELSMKVANEAVAPLNARAKEAWKSVQDTVAA